MRSIAPVTMVAVALLLALSACIGGGRATGREARPEQPNFHYQLGIAALQDNKPQDAVVEFNQALRADRKDTRVIYGLGHAYFIIQNYDAAREQMERLIELDPENGDAVNYLGNILEKQGREEEAIATYERAMSMPTYRSVHLPMHNLSRIYLARGDWARAEKMLVQALRRVPEYLAGIADLAHIYLNRSMWPEAVTQWDLFTKLAPKAPDGHFFLATALAGDGKTVAARLAIGEYFRVAGTDHPLYADATALRDRLDEQVR